MQIIKKVVFSRWLVHYGILVKSWMGGHHHDLICDSSGFPIESVHHVVWICPTARVVWKSVLRILYHVCGKQMYTWGGVLEMEKVC